MRSSLFCAYFSRFSGEVCYYNLSPQGDGNDAHIPCLDMAQITTYPRKGTETLLLQPRLPKDTITTYPRKGTETSASGIRKNRAATLQLIPVRGRLPLALFIIEAVHAVTTSPRKTLSGAARQLSRRESLVQGNGSCESSPRRGSWHGVSRD